MKINRIEKYNNSRKLNYISKEYFSYHSLIKVCQKFSQILLRKEIQFSY